MTRAQGESAVWLAEHCGRVISSMVHRVIKRRATTLPDCLVGEIMKYKEQKPLHKSDPRLYGHEMEPKARLAYINHTHRRECDARTAGMFVDENIPFLATSPDGLVQEEDAVGVLEIKCPASQHTVEVLASCPKNFCLQQSQNGLKLKRSHPYFC